MRLLNTSAYPDDILARVAVWSLLDLDEDARELLADWTFTFQNMSTDWPYDHEEGVTHNDGRAFIYLRSSYDGHPLYTDVWDAVVDVTRHEAEHAIVFAREHTYFGRSATGVKAARPGPAPETAPPTEVVVAETDGPLSAEKIQAIIDTVGAKFDEADEAQCTRAGFARLDEWRGPAGLAAFERDQIKFGKLQDQTRWG